MTLIVCCRWQSALLSTVDLECWRKLSALSFNHAVELDMLVGVIAGAFNFNREDMKQLRAQSVKM